MLLEYKTPFEGQFGPVPYEDWLWKAAGLVGKGLVAFSAGYYLAEGIDKGDVAKTAGAAGTALMTVAEVATFSDEIDPFRRGQENTMPGPGERTTNETVTLDATYPVEPVTGAALSVTTSWIYTRHTVDASGSPHQSTHAVSGEAKTNLHPAGAYTLTTNQTSYQRGDTALIAVTIAAVRGALLEGDEAYVSVLVGASQQHTTSVVLYDDGSSGDEVAGDGIYSRSVVLDSSWPAGQWGLFLFAQENLFGFNEYGGLAINGFPVGGPADQIHLRITVN